MVGGGGWVPLAALLALAVAGPGPPPMAFPHELYNLTIPENSPPRTRALPPPGAPPPGLPLPSPGARVRYRIRHGDKDKLFKAEERTVGDFCFLSVRTRANSDVLNRERRDAYRLEVRATATLPGGATLEADAALLVTVSDVNDLSPLFYPTEYEATVREDVPPHSSVLRVQAEDADLGLNGEIYYSLLKPNDQFDVHPTSGVLTTTRPLAVVERASHELVVLARDRASLLARGDSAPAARARVLLHVATANLHAPEIRARKLPELVENSTAEIYAIVEVTDPDDAEHGRIASVEIVDGDPDGHFRVRPSLQLHEWDVVAHALLDREAAPQGYNLTLRAQDAGRPPRAAYIALPVTLTDANDNAPVFSRRVYEARVPETAPVATPVLRLKVSDRDAGRNARVYLEIVGGNEGGEFTINGDTGVLYTAVQLDAEEHSQYTLTVSAIDQGPAGARHQSSAKVKIQVVDANDNDPVFTVEALDVAVPENAPAGHVVARLTARDADSGENAYISYSIANVQPVPFEVDHFSGAVRTTRKLDYESSRRQWTLRVRASDWGLPYRRQTELALTVRLTDVNDNRPQFEREDCVGYVSRRAPPGTALATLSAIDFDAGDVVAYRIAGGNDDGCFSLDSATGVLMLACDLLASRADTRVLNVTATDGAHFADPTPLTLHLVSSAPAAATLECRDTGAARRLTELLAAAEQANAPVDVTDEFPLAPARYGENLHAPEFVDFPVEVKVNESVSLGSRLVVLRARDRDLGYNGLLVFALSGGDPDSAFRVDPESGALEVIGHLDRERETEYYLNVTVYDLGRPQRAVSRLLPVTVLDANDNAPRFERSLASFRVTENALNGTTLFRANATDRDTGRFARIAYSLNGADGEFCVGRTSGTVTVCAPLDRERRALYELSVRATDGGGLWAEARVRVTVDDVNDNAPRFPLAAYSTRVREDVPPGALVAVLVAADPDDGAGGRLQYSLPDHAADDAMFTIDRLSGALRTTKWLDFEERQVHGVVVRCTDGGQPALSAEVTVVVEVVDVDENGHAPQFSDPLALAGSVREDAAVGSPVLTAAAADADPPGRDSRLSYYLVGGDGMAHFTIDDTGVIRTATPLDRETSPHYWLTVAAEDNGLIPKYTTVQVYIEVSDVNDVSPWPDVALYRALVVEHAPAGTHVAKVHADDGDASPTPTNVTYSIVAGNPDGLFSIDEHTGEIVTTGRALDRESLAAHALEVRCSDGQLWASARVLVTLLDINDHAPTFAQRFYDIRVPTSEDQDIDNLPQADGAAGDESSTEWEGEGEEEDERGSWDSARGGEAAGWRYIASVVALDGDLGVNGTVRYSGRARGRARQLLRVHATSGRLLAAPGLRIGPKDAFEMTIRACDGGDRPQCGVCRASVRGVSRGGGHPPALPPVPPLQVAELDAPGFLLAVVQASDPDGDALYYDIASGDDDQEFYIGRDDGSLVLARRLLWERRPHYALNVTVTDGLYTANTIVNITVINDAHEGGVWFSQEQYEVSLEAPGVAGAPLATLTAQGAPRLRYGLQDARRPHSMKLFRVHETTGVLELTQPLVSKEWWGVHQLTVWARDSAPRSSRALARVAVVVESGLDGGGAPVWARRLLQARLSRSAPPGALVTRLRAAAPTGGPLLYSLATGDAAGLFTVEPVLGEVRLSRALPPSGPHEYPLSARATPARGPAASLPLHVTVVEPDDAPPRFVQSTLVCSVPENSPAGVWLVTVEARGGGGGVRYSLRGGRGRFSLTPGGTLLTAMPLDYEHQSLYNLTITAITMGGGTSEATVTVHVVDCNEFPPELTAREYHGQVSEAAPIGTLVTDSTEGSRQPLVLTTHDGDSPAHRQRAFEVVEPRAAALFKVDPTTGALRIIAPLDYEDAKEHRFTVKVLDMGTPRLVADSWATVTVEVRDVNDCAPTFGPTGQQSNEFALLLPTARGVVVAAVPASDPDLPDGGKLQYHIIEGDPSGQFSITPNGTILVERADSLAESYSLRVRASDGQLSTSRTVRVRPVRAPPAGLAFPSTDRFATATENTTKPATVAVLDVLGAALNEHVQFTILNPVDEFEVGLTSGALRTTGLPLDRESRDQYTLLVQARSVDRDEERVAHCRVHVTVADVNDNCPLFVERPYVGAVLAGAEPGTDVIRVRAVDADIGDNGEVRYEMKRGPGELFRLDRRSGRLSLRQTIDHRAANYTLLVAAYDGGVPACSSEAEVVVRVWSGGAAPAWPWPRYELIAREDAPPGQPIGQPLQAISPMQRQLIYSIVDTDPASEGLFDIHFETAPDRGNSPCALVSLVPLDYESARSHSLTLRATDPVTGGSADVSVTLTLTDVNDCAPEMDRDEFAAAVSEAALQGDLVLAVRALDNDTGANGEVWFSLSVPPGGANASLALFAVDGGGAVRVAGVLDAESAPRHHLVLTASDRGRPARSTTAHLFITVEDVNDNEPIMERSVVSALVSWEASRGVAVARVAAWDPDSGDAGRLVLAQAGGQRRAFDVDPGTGLVTLVEPALWAQRAATGGQTLNVTASDGAHAKAARLQLSPAPANRHAPRFPHLVHEARTVENLPPPQLLTTVKAYDDDLGEYGTVTYSIPSAKLRETFAIDASTGALTTLVPLDRERRAEWEVVVAAADGGGLRRHTTVRVRVNDANDCAPAFALAEYRAAVRYDRPPMAPFLTLSAHDADGPEHARVTYSIYEGDVQSDARGLFHIDAHTGALAFARNGTDFAGRVVQVWIRARDAGGLAGEAPVSVSVLGVGERPPALAALPPDLYLPEDAPPGTLIAELRPAEGAGPEPPEYRLAAALWPRHLFAIDAAGRLTLAGQLDRESSSEHVIGIIASGAGSPAPAVLLTTRLHVLDINEHAPVFHSQPYTLHVAENTPPDTSLIQLMAEDPDAGSNGEVRYSLEEDSMGLFAVDAASGWVVTRGTLDRETRAEHRLAVLATDGGTPPRVSHGSLIVRLIDYNDCPHAFQQESYTAEVPEDAPAGTVVCRLSVEDGDAVSPSLTFLVAGGDPRARFQLRPSGELLVARPLDRETESVYWITVAATDGKFTAYTTVNVTVLDVNDNPPYCVRPRYVSLLSEAAPLGTRVTAVLTADEDASGEPPLYSLSGDHHHHFSIDKDTGSVTVAAALDRESRGSYWLTAHARDRQRPAWGCTSELVVELSDVNDNAPQFTASQYSATMPEDAELGSLVAKVHATDADLGENRLVRYEWAEEGGGGDMFELALTSGIITLRSPLDRETQAEHRLVVTARDNGNPPLSATATVRLSVSDVNDNPPEFEFREYRATVSELAMVGATVLRVGATSQDTGVNAEVRYELVGGDDHQDFTIDPTTGELSVARLLDYERRAHYFLSVQAIDGGTPPLSDLATVNVTITDANDNAPLFPRPVYEARVREDAAPGSPVLQVIADDADSGSNGRLTYSITHGDPSGRFAVEPGTGQLTVAAPLDRESLAEYTLEVRATDGGRPPLEGSAAVRVEVLDANDNAPRLESANYSAVVREDRPLGHLVATLRVTDADAPPNGAPFTFDLQGGNEAGAFRVEQDGSVRTAARFSRRIRERYSLRVRVFDNGAPPLYTDAWINVRVVEESQYPPVVTPLEVALVSYRDSFPGGVLGRVFASDRDPYDTLTFGLAPTPGSELFTLDSADGTLRAAPRLDAGEYRLNATVSDGRYSGHAAVRVAVLSATDELLSHAAVVRFRAVSAADFVLGHRKGFVRAVAEAVEREPSDVLLVGAQPSDLARTDDEGARRRRQVARDLDVAFVVRDEAGWVPLERLRRCLHGQVERLEERTRLVVEELVRAGCAGGCGPGECREAVRLRGAPAVIASDVYALVAPAHRITAACHCPHPYTGERCEREHRGCDTADGDGSSCCGESCSSGGVVWLGGDGYLSYRLERGVVAGGRLLDDELQLTLRFRTRRPRGTLLSARGIVDYATLELDEGRLRFTMELGGGAVTVSSGEALHDGAWHEARLERRGAAVRLAVDRRSATAGAPPPNAVLDVRPDRVLVGAQLLRHAHALAPEQVTYGFEGCIADLKLGGSPLPLEEGGSGGDGRAQLVRRVRARVGDACPALGAPGACAAHPCLHGGSCRELPAAALLDTGSDDAFACECHARYSGPRCEVESDPCAMQPCLHGGRCSEDARASAGYRCECAPGLSGARCEAGRWCGPAACRHGGGCEEGEWGPSCRCRGYYGPRCDLDVDECAGEPCLNGATCVNEPGSFRCVCPPDRTGSHCGNPLHSVAVTSGAVSGLAEAWRWALAARWPLAAAAAAALALLLAVVLPLALRSRRRRPLAKAPLNSRQPTPRSKLSNLEADRRDRPPSVAPVDPPPLNNMDTLRSYGSAGDELETLPPHYIRNLNLDAPDRKPWSEQMHLHTFVDNKIYNDLKSCTPCPRRAPPPPSPLPGPGPYHWDCSDWCPSALPPVGLCEVPAAERRDSSSPAALARLPPPAPFASPPSLPLPLDSDEPVDERDRDTEADTDGLTDASPFVPPPSVPSPSTAAPRRRRDPDAASLITMLEERNSLLGGYGNGSCSDMSMRLCEIEDTDTEEEEEEEEEGEGEGEGRMSAQARHTAV